MANKVKFNIHDVHYAVWDGEEYSTPVAMPGAVSITLDAQGDKNDFYADGIVYYTSIANTGYEGSLELALLDDNARKDLLGEVLDSANKLMFEKTNVDPVHFALGFSIDGNNSTTKFWFYNCTASRPSTTAQTNEATITPQTESIDIQAAPQLFEGEGYVRVKCSDATASSYATWYTGVVVPS